MDVLLHNPLAEMYGPKFLLFYGFVAMTTLAICRYAIYRLDPTRGQEPPRIAQTLDPYEVAYMRGGKNEVARVAIFSLIQRGYLEDDNLVNGSLGSLTGRNKRRSNALVKAVNPPSSNLLTPMERLVVDYFSIPKESKDIFKDRLPEQLSLYCADYEQKLNTQSFLSPPEVTYGTIRIRRIGFGVILGLGGYKLAAALLNGHDNVFLLIFIAAIASLFLVKTCSHRNLSARGELYLKNLRHAFEGLKSKARTHSGDIILDNPLALMVGIYGVGSLNGTPYEYYPQMFARSSVSSTNSSGGGSSCASSGGCGGGGGSSGGCGGGGGGGGCGGCGGGS